MADSNREDVTHVKIENIEFNEWVILYTEGLVTLNGCTIYDWTLFFMHKSQYEADFIYKTAEMIPSVINNKTINIRTGYRGNLKVDYSSHQLAALNMLTLANSMRRGTTVPFTLNK